jgi:carboxypeptidase Taq
VHHVERGLIRVDADEVTYPLHVILRYELEQELVNGKLEASRDAGGLGRQDDATISACRPSTTPTARCRTCIGRCGAFGYFPSYTLGAMMAAQQWAALEKAQPGVRDDIRKGEFGGVNQWRSDNIWTQGSRWSTPDLITKATGEPLNADFFKAHLKKRYLG